MRRILALTLALTAVAGLAAADTARVFSGEHATFTRLVVELPAASDWTVGRTAIGYAFATGAVDQPAYDLSRVWDRIPRDRLQALRVDPESGALQLSLGCPCHVFPFEYRPGMIVLDIKDGPAPPGSSFELAFALPRAGPAVDLAPFAAPASPRRFDWLAMTLPQGQDRALDQAPLPLPSGTVSLDPLRAELLEQISRGAAQGVVDMALPGPAPRVPANEVEVLPWSQIRIGPLPGVAAGGRPPEGLTAEGAACFAEDDLDLPAWGAGQPASTLLSEARSGLFGEFDRVAEDAVLQSIRLHLYLGFGAEAAQISQLLDSTAPPPILPAYLSMARLVDGDTDPTTPFAGMLGCDGAAALWSALAYDRLPPGSQVNVGAIVRNFVALPQHLRGTLGPGLADKLLQRGDSDAARIVRDAVERSADTVPGEVALLDARSSLVADQAEAARSHALAAVASGSRTMESLIALVEAHFRDMTPVSPDVATALQAFKREQKGTDAFPAVLRALVLALALSGQTSAAFAEAEAEGIDRSDLWQVAQARATDDDFLRQAVLPVDTAAPPLRESVALAVATRLLDLGFADPALAWLGPVTATAPDAQRRIAARAELLRGDARMALTLLDQLTAPEDEALRAAALVQLGRLDPARQAFAAAGMTEEADRLLPWEADWDRLRAEGGPVWSDAAAATDPPEAEAAGPLARGSAMVEESAAARARIDALLSAVPLPEAELR